MENALISVRGLKTYFKADEGLRKAVDGVDLDVEKGELIGVAGESGCGKSTLALSMLRLIQTPGRIVGGEIWFEGKDLLTLSEDEMRKIRGKRISMIFQEPMTSLSPVHRIRDQIVDVIVKHEGVSKETAVEKATSMLEAVRISDPSDMIKTYPHQLSGGMRQRVMIAMALSCHPDLLIADEPTSALDVITQLEIVKLLGELEKKFGMALMLISHNLYLIAETCKRIGIMYMGNMIEFSETSALFKEPLHPYTVGLLDSIPKLEPCPKEFCTIKGEVPDPNQIPTGCPFHPRCNYAMKICIEQKPILTAIAEGRLVACHLFDKK